MVIVYYYDADLQIAPVKQFLSKYLVKPHDNQKQVEHKNKMFALINEVLKKATESRGIVGGQFSEPLKGSYHFQALRIKDSDVLNRIFYFCYYREKLVLLNAFDKPDYYDKGLKKKVDREYAKVLIQTEEYYNKFINNPKSYKKYEE